MKTVFTVEQENIVCIYHRSDRRRTMTAITDALPDMGEDMRELAMLTLDKLRCMTDAEFESYTFTFTDDNE